ncbi:hypothetical protein D9V37_11310 [Nocardioides mangrovicus]|uniref:NlpC/P60 domain-containing protein n=1 Tax=Nocardioides mangrovicus TaxID=2478913 RepID=A0A3L8P2R6_9ACTN|nr:NlpC/P60 family protein [Nocardioides mangrovicus]RLV49143.1 hypothetical protein D9V37_11310 [Nocardioides mangrovicus]
MTTLLVGGLLGLHAAAPAAADPGSPDTPTAATSPLAEPRIDKVKKKVDRLYAQAEEASERYNAARIQLHASRVRLTALQSALSQQQKVVDRLRNDVAALVVQQYQGNSLSTASQVVFSSDSRAFIDNLNAASSYNSQRGQVIAGYQVQLKQLKLRRQAADDQVTSLTRTRSTLRTQKQVIDKKAAAAKAVLSDLQEKQRLAMMAGVDPSQYQNLGYTGAAGTAVKYALAQVGKPYVWGAAGPSSFDCSGLMMAAWGQAGVGLPHSSSAQMGSGTPVSEADLQPGDLVFYYSPVHHVGMYIGNGLIVNAENPSVGVRVTGLHAMPYSGAVRPG